MEILEIKINETENMPATFPVEYSFWDLEFSAPFWDGSLPDYSDFSIVQKFCPVFLANVTYIALQSKLVYLQFCSEHNFAVGSFVLHILILNLSQEDPLRKIDKCETNNTFGECLNITLAKRNWHYIFVEKPVLYTQQVVKACKDGWRSPLDLITTKWKYQPLKQDFLSSWADTHRVCKSNPNLPLFTSKGVVDEFVSLIKINHRKFPPIEAIYVGLVTHQVGIVNNLF